VFKIKNPKVEFYYEERESEKFDERILKAKDDVWAKDIKSIKRKTTLADIFPLIADECAGMSEEDHDAYYLRKGIITKIKINGKTVWERK